MSEDLADNSISKVIALARGAIGGVRAERKAKDEPIEPQTFVEGLGA